MESWHIWVVVALVLFILELTTSGFLLACFGVGCLFGALAAAFGLDFKLQIIIFCLSSLVVFIVIRPFILKLLPGKKDGVRTNVGALIGRTGIVCEKIDPVKDTGRVKVGGDDWKAVSDDRTVFEEGEHVTVIRVEGTKLYVKR